MSQQTLEQNKPVFPISSIANELEVHQRTLRIYDDEKILVPRRSLKGRRLYSMYDLEKGKLVLYMTRELGINLAGVRIILELAKELKVHNSSLDGVTSKELIQEIAKSLNITFKEQEENKIKLSKRGRKPSN